MITINESDFKAFFKKSTKKPIVFPSHLCVVYFLPCKIKMSNFFFIKTNLSLEKKEKICYNKNESGFFR